MNKVRDGVRRFLKGFILLAAFAVAGCGDKGHDAPKGVEPLQAVFPKVLAAGNPAVDFQSKEMDGTPVRLSAFRGKAVILFFWRMNCPECKASMPSLDALGKKFKGLNPLRGLVIIALNEDSMHSAAVEEVQAFLQNGKFSFKNIREEDGYVAEAYSVFKAPQAFVIGRDGVIAAVKEGRTDWMSAENVGMMELLLKK
ncbi:MAG: TlpA family protein disulfide reductase [Deltaproteobacteria bacterium]|nr:TlpA family protein disulfide reductase [Deltaproteobacteria bacterium]